LTCEEIVGEIMLTSDDMCDICSVSAFFACEDVVNVNEQVCSDDYKEKYCTVLIH
jgi:hypothetical protein